MAPAKKPETTKEEVTEEAPVAQEQQEPVVTPEMLEQAKASAAKADAAFRKEQEEISAGKQPSEGEDRFAGLDKPRTKQAATRLGPVVGHMPYPENFGFDEYGPQGLHAKMHGEITGQVDSQEFIIDVAGIREGLPVEKPGRNLPKKRLYCVKGLHRDGRLVQLPFEPQIQNNAGGDPEDAIGLRRYQRKGIKLLFDFETMRPFYCAAWDCWAEAGPTGFCSERHAKHTLPNRYKDAGVIMSGLMEQGVTTSRTWSV